MAVTTEVTSYFTAQESDGSLNSCLNGGEDFRTLKSNYSTTESLYCRGWSGDNISSACKIVSVQIVSGYARVRDGGSNIATFGNFKLSYKLHMAHGNISGSTFTRSGDTHGVGFGERTINDSTSWRSIVGEKSSFDSVATKYPDWVVANKVYPTLILNIRNDYGTKVRAYFKDLKITVIRTRACYITFKGDGVTENTTMYDYGTVPSYGSTPTRYGYTFKGWSNGSTTYSGTLPTAYEQDVTYTAVWEKNKVSCTITYDGNGATSGSVAAQSGYVGDSLTLRDNGFYKKCIVTFYSNENPNITDDSLDELQTSVSSATFLGWYTAASGGSQVTSPYTPNSESITLYAHWSGMSAITTPTLTRDGYTFLGWYTARSGGSKVADGGSYTPSGTIALYAHWKLNEITDIYIGTSILDVYIGNSKYDVYQGTTKIYG